MNEIFYGRPDGLGNRIEELLKLSSFAVENNIQFKYYWNNTNNFKYPYRFITRNIEVIEINHVSNWPTKNFESTNLWRKYISQYNYIYENQIKMNFDLPSLSNDYLGIHIRGGDRLISTTRVQGLKYGGFSDTNLLDICIDKTLKYLQKNNITKPLALFGDDPIYLEKLRVKLKDYHQIQVPYDSFIENPYIDFYYLTQSSEVVMSSLLSTFAVTAAMLGSNELVTFFDDRETTLHKFSTKLKKFEIPEKSRQQIDLNINFKPVDNSYLIKIGSEDKSEFALPKEIIENTDILISDINSSDYCFQENFKLLNPSARVYFIKKSILRIAIYDIFKIIRTERNRKIKLKKYFSEFKKTSKVFNYKVVNWLDSRFYKKINPNKNYLLISDETNVSLKKFIFSKNLVGAIIKFDNYDLSKFPVVDFQKINHLKLAHLELFQSHEMLNTGYMTFIKDSPSSMNTERKQNYYENNPNKISINFIN